MTDGPQQCALPGCSETVEQPDDGGPRRLYCSPAHRAAARKMRHAARMDAATEPASTVDLTKPISTEPERQPDESTTQELPAPLAASGEPEPDPGQAPGHEWSPAAAWTISPPALRPAPTGRTVRTITSKRVKKEKPARTAGDRKNAAASLRRRAVASVAIASLVAGGTSYFVTQNVVPTAPTVPPQTSPQPTMEADVWAGQAEVVLASLSSQLDAVAQAEAIWLALPEQRRAQEPAAVQALRDRKALLEQQRATLMSQLEALRALPDLTTELTSAQAQLDAVERTLNESTTTAASPDYQEAVRQLEEQRDMRRQQRDHAARQLADLRDGVDEALRAPLPEEKDQTSPIVERVRAVAEGRPDPAEKDDDPKHDVADGEDSQAVPRREDGDEERDDVGTTAPPDPERPSIPDVLADGARESRADADRTSQGLGNQGNGGDSPGGPVDAVANNLGGVFGGNDDSDRSDQGAERDDDRGNGWSNRDDEDRDDDRGGLGGLTDGLFGDSDRDDRDDRDDRNNQGDDRDDRSGWWGGDRGDDDERGGRDDRGDEDDDHGGLDDITDGLIGDSDRDERDDRNNQGDDQDDRSGWWGGDRGDDDERGGRDDRGDEDDDRGGLDDITDGLVGGSDRDQDESEDRGNGQAGERAEDRDDQRGGDDQSAENDDERKRPIGKAERERQRSEENSDSRSDASDKSDNRDEKGRASDKDGSEKTDSDDDRDKQDRASDEDDSDKDSDKAGSDDDSDKDSDKSDSDDDDSDKDSDKSDSGDSDGGDSDGGDSDDGDSGGGDSDGGDSDGGDSDGGDSGGDD